MICKANNAKASVPIKNITQSITNTHTRTTHLHQPMSLADYLAKNYLTKDPSSKQRKRRKKDKDRGEGIIIEDGDATGWGRDGDEREGGKGKGLEDDEGVLVVRDGHSADFRKKRFSSWITTPSAGDDDHGAAEATAILAQATLERAAQEAEEAADADVAAAAAAGDDVVRLESGAHAGLQTASQVAAAVAKKRAEDLAALRALQSSDGAAAAKSQETIYRDASGRVVNIAMARAEARRAADEARAKEAADTLRRVGGVQLRQVAEAKKELEDARFKTLARYKDDTELNEELKAKERWEDPALAFLTTAKKSRGADGGRLPRKTYQGPFQPNRYGIRPGWRWDGVDRGNGFEKKWFEARATRESKRNLEYLWELDE